ncbi:MAG: terpene synthase family protein [Blastocatellia bacterium]
MTQPFQLPEFYLPHPARLNPNLDAARKHSKAWACEMGILEAEQEAGAKPIWDEVTFAADDYALLCAYTHPEAPEAELNLITDWYVWVFYFDDHFLEVYKRTRDRAGGKAYLDRIPLFMSYTVRMNPNLDASRRNTIAWCHRMGFFDSVPGLPGIGLWDERRLAGFDFPLCAAAIHPDASLDELDITSGWLSWGTYADDFLPVVYGYTRDMAGARLFIARLSLFMPLDSTSTPPPLNPAERSLADLWNRTSAPMSLNAKRQFRVAVERMVQSWLWELANQIQNRIPDPVDYIEMRRKTFGADMTMSLAQLSVGDGVSGEIFATRPLQELIKAAQDYACFTNDVFSYQKEIEFEGEFHNLILVLEKFLDIGREQAVEVVNDLMTARMRQFETIIETELEPLYEDFGLEDPARERLKGFVELLQLWMSGILNWHRGTGRYSESSLLNTPTPGRVVHGIPGRHCAAARIGRNSVPAARAEVPSGQKTRFKPPRSPDLFWLKGNNDPDGRKTLFEKGGY